MMRKSTTFDWAWSHYAYAPDATMTRERAARLLRAWRRCTRQHETWSIHSANLERIGMHEYRIERMGDIARMRINHAYGADHA